MKKYRYCFECERGGKWFVIGTVDANDDTDARIKATQELEKKVDTGYVGVRLIYLISEDEYNANPAIWDAITNLRINK